MKRKIILMGLAMFTGLPNVALAKGIGRGDSGIAYASWNAPYVPHYGAEGITYPLMDHLSVAAVSPSRNTSNEWRLEFAPPATVSGVEDPMTAKDKRVGFSLKLDF